MAYNIALMLLLFFTVANGLIGIENFKNRNPMSMFNMFVFGFCSAGIVFTIIK